VVSRRSHTQNAQAHEYVTLLVLYIHYTSNVPFAERMYAILSAAASELTIFSVRTKAADKTLK
jgi:hypothetical protein